MGQKTNPIGFRLGISKSWRSTWYASGKNMPQLLQEDALLRKYLKQRMGHAAISDVRIERKPGKVVVTIHTGRPGVVIGKKGAEVDKLRDELAQLTGQGSRGERRGDQAPRGRGAARRRQHRAAARGARVVPPRDEARRAERDALRRAGDQGQGGWPVGRRRDRARRRAITKVACPFTRCARTSTTRRRRRRPPTAPSVSRCGSSRAKSWKIAVARRTRPARKETTTMLSPKRVKFRKMFKGRMTGLAHRGSEISFGHFGLMALEPGWVSARQIEAARIALTRHIKRGGKVWIRIFPDKPITKKPAETRMGKGKGSPELWVAVVKPGRMMFELEGVTPRDRREGDGARRREARREDRSSWSARRRTPMKLDDIRALGAPRAAGACDGACRRSSSASASVRRPRRSSSRCACVRCAATSRAC